MGSQTQTQTSIPAEADVEQTAVLRLRGEHEPGTTRTIHWAEDVVDNEGLGRKSSKGTYVRPYVSMYEVASSKPGVREPCMQGSARVKWRGDASADNVYISVLYLPRTQSGRRIEFRR